MTPVGMEVIRFIVMISLPMVPLFETPEKEDIFEDNENRS
jgi:hypothetical protein